MKTGTNPAIERSIANGIASGFSLLETMFSMVVVLIAGLALLQGMELTVLQYNASQDRWEMILQRWNDTEVLRSTPPQDQETIQIIPGARPLSRQLVGHPHPGQATLWEVLRAEK